MYHGTSLPNAMNISRNGFDRKKIKSYPRGFFFATWPGVPLKYGGRDGTVVLVCKVLLGEKCQIVKLNTLLPQLMVLSIQYIGHVRFLDKENIKTGSKIFDGCDSLVHWCTKDRW